MARLFIALALVLPWAASESPGDQTHDPFANVPAKLKELMHKCKKTHPDRCQACLPALPCLLKKHGKHPKGKEKSDVHTLDTDESEAAKEKTKQILKKIAAHYPNKATVLECDGVGVPKYCARHRNDGGCASSFTPFCAPLIYWASYNGHLDAVHPNTTKANCEGCVKAEEDLVTAFIDHEAKEKNEAEQLRHTEELGEERDSWITKAKDTGVKEQGYDEAVGETLGGWREGFSSNTITPDDILGNNVEQLHTDAEAWAHWLGLHNAAINNANHYDDEARKSKAEADKKNLIAEAAEKVVKKKTDVKDDACDKMRDGWYVSEKQISDLPEWMQKIYDEFDDAISYDYDYDYDDEGE